MWVERLNFGNVSSPDFRDLQDLGNFFLGDPFLYFKYWNSGTVVFYINGFNMKPIRLLNATRCSFFDFSSLATLVVTFVSWTHFWSNWSNKSMFYRLSNLGVPPFWPTSDTKFYVFHYYFYVFIYYKPDTWWNTLTALILERYYTDTVMTILHQCFIRPIKMQIKY